ncbi:MAG: hypothetical protein MUP69_05630 [Candidatus Atribacteria bacterium]|nr:hypothetical protein [Candidatus Atribacteria bacterium]
MPANKTKIKYSKRGNKNIVNPKKYEYKKSYSGLGAQELPQAIQVISLMQEEQSG